MVATITVRCRLFARYADGLPSTETALELPAGSTVADAVRLLRTRPAGARLPDHPLVAVALEHATYDRVLQDGDELGVLPPLAGG